MTNKGTPKGSLEVHGHEYEIKFVGVDVYFS